MYDSGGVVGGLADRNAQTQMGIVPPLPILACSLTGAADASHHGGCAAVIDGTRL
jgi:hypothetical protein